MSLPNFVVDVDTVCLFKTRLDKFWMHQDVMYDFGLLDNSWIRQLADCQLADWTTRGLDISRTGQLAD